MEIQIKIGIGEAIDRATILIIKEEKIADEDKLKNINLELDLLTNKLLPVPELPEMKDLFGKLLGINSELWDVEDALRVMEDHKDFGIKFIELARSVYRLNDERAAIKKKINKLYNSKIVEEKSY